MTQKIIVIVIVIVEQRGNERSCAAFHVCKATTLTENYKAAYKLWGKRGQTKGQNYC
jgi:hypothetical protein